MGHSESRDSIADVWGPRTPQAGNWPVRVDEHLIEQPDRWVQSACVLCANGCGLDIGVKDGRMVGVRGRQIDKVNRGRLGPKGLHGWQANASADRLTRPLIRRGGMLQEATWEEAMELIVSRSKELIRDYTANAMGFYHTGQLMLEEYYTLALIALGGLGTTHLDANTRLCTATAETALRESFGTDGQPGSYEDIDLAEVIFHIGHNVASQQTVLWSRILDRLHGANAPRLLVVDPRRTATAKQAYLHLAPRAGTNLVLMNGLLHLVIRAGAIDRGFIDAHTVGFPALAELVARYPPERVAQICDVQPARLEEAAELLGSAPSLVSTVLQGVYQSPQATAAAVQVNNLHLIRGMIGKPGCSVFQMNGQPSAQNSRECGASGTFPGMRNWQNPAHVEEIARIWNVEASKIPSYTEPTHAMEIFRRAEQGSLRMLWITCTNPAVSMPELSRIRRILGKPGLFLVVQDAFLTETAQFADVVLPAAMWGEKTGTFTNTERTVHIAHKAVEPPGEARSDFDIWVDYAQRMDLRDKDGLPLVKWSTPEEAFDGWRQMSAGRPCDYSGLNYPKLTGGSGISWPCNAQFPEGKPRLYTDGVFNTEASYCQGFGHILLNGGEQSPEQYRQHNPAGRAILKAADYEPPAESPNEEFPFTLTTGRVVYHWHTRTKTGRVKSLQEAAPEAFVQIAEADAVAQGIGANEWVEVRTRRGSLRARARVGDIRSRHLFVPFHYGYWDLPGNGAEGRERAANETTQPACDPVSKQPYLKSSAAQLFRIEEQTQGEQMNHNGEASRANVEKKAFDAVSAYQIVTTPKVPGLHVPVYLTMVQPGEEALAAAYESVAQRHADNAEVKTRCEAFAVRCREQAAGLHPLLAQYGSSEQPGATSLMSTLSGNVGMDNPSLGDMAMLGDLHNLHTMTNHLGVGFFALKQAGSAMNDAALRQTAERRMEELSVEQAWLNRQIRSLAAQALVVP